MSMTRLRCSCGKTDLPLARPAPFLREQHDRCRSFLVGTEPRVGPFVDSAVRSLQSYSGRSPDCGGRCSGRGDWQGMDWYRRKDVARVGEKLVKISYSTQPGLIHRLGWVEGRMTLTNGISERHFSLQAS